MNNKEFEDKLSQVADWRVPKPTTSPTLRTDKDHVEQVIVENPSTGEKTSKDLSMASNATLPIEITQIKPKPCQHCERTVTDQVIKIKRHMTPTPHWRQRCSACRLYMNPFTNKFELGEAETPRYWGRFLRD